jgi:type I site-specific restriction endonuclease
MPPGLYFGRTIGVAQHPGPLRCHRDRPDGPPAAHTTTYFRDVVFRYEYERAVREGYLVDYDAVKINSDVRMNGIFLHEGEHVGIVDPESGSE